MNTSRWSLICSIVIFLLLMAVPSGHVQASCPPATADVYVSTSTCTVAANTTSYVDVGSGSTSTGVLHFDNATGSLTISQGDSTHPGGDLRVGSISFTAQATLSIQQGSYKGSIHPNAGTWMTDQDQDGYPASTTFYTSSGTNLVRVNAILSTATVDCNDNDGGSGATHVWLSHAQCYADLDKDTYTNGLQANTTCLNAASCNSATEASNSTLGATMTAYTAGQLTDNQNLNSKGANDCNDLDPNNWVLDAYSVCSH